MGIPTVHLIRFSVCLCNCGDISFIFRKIFVVHPVSVLYNETFFFLTFILIYLFFLISTVSLSCQVNVFMVCLVLYYEPTMLCGMY